MIWHHTFDSIGIIVMAESPATRNQVIADKVMVNLYFELFDIATFPTRCGHNILIRICVCYEVLNLIRPKVS